MNTNQKKDFAKILYLNEPHITVAELAERVGVADVTIYKWKREGKWEELKTSLLTEKVAILAHYYRQLREWNNYVDNKPDGEKFLLSKESDAVVKITAAIKNLETETNVADKMETGKEFLTFIRKIAEPQIVTEVALLFDAYIKSLL